MKSKRVEVVLSEFGSDVVLLQMVQAQNVLTKVEGFDLRCAKETKLCAGRHQSFYRPNQLQVYHTGHYFPASTVKATILESIHLDTEFNSSLKKRKKSPPTTTQPMAKTKSSKANKNKSKMTSESPEQLYAQAISYLEQSEPENALSTAQKLLTVLPPSNPQLALPALNLLGEINVELGAPDEARAYFLQASQIDPEGSIPEALGGGAEKFLWLAQLCEEGGAESVGWFEKGVGALKHEISVLEAQQDGGKLSDEEREGTEELLEEKREKLAEALCGVVEVYMTDLSYVSRMRACFVRLTWFADHNFCAGGKQMLKTVAKHSSQKLCL